MTCSSRPRKRRDADATARRVRQRSSRGPAPPPDVARVDSTSVIAFASARSGRGGARERRGAGARAHATGTPAEGRRSRAVDSGSPGWEGSSPPPVAADRPGASPHRRAWSSAESAGRRGGFPRCRHGHQREDAARRFDLRAGPKTAFTPARSRNAYPAADIRRVTTTSPRSFRSSHQLGEQRLVAAGLGDTRRRDVVLHPWGDLLRCLEERPTRRRARSEALRSPSPASWRPGHLATRIGRRPDRPHERSISRGAPAIRVPPRRRAVDAGNGATWHGSGPDLSSASEISPTVARRGPPRRRAEEVPLPFALRSASSDARHLPGRGVSDLFSGRSATPGRTVVTSRMSIVAPRRAELLTPR